MDEELQQSEEDLRTMVALGCRWNDNEKWQEVRSLPKVQAAAMEVLEEFMGSWKDINVDKGELRAGIEVEMEHTSNLMIAEKIARDHLAEDPQYYQKLLNVGL